MDYIYLDNAATTPVDEGVLQKMKPYFGEIYGNAHSQHCIGRRAAYAVDCARDLSAGILKCRPEDIYFTSGGSEANNWAVKGVCTANYGKKRRIIVSAIEHPSVLEAARAMEVFGFETTLIYPDNQGIVRPQSVEKELEKGDAAIVCVMAVNNETGVIQPYGEIYSLCRAAGVHYHCDCVQAAGCLAVNGGMADSLSLSAHKFYGPKGVGSLVINKNARIYPLINGGSQERGRRGGTTNVPAVVGFAEALKLAAELRESENKRLAALRDKILNGLDLPFVKLNGSLSSRVPSNLNLRLEGYVNTQIMAYLDRFGITVSAGSACTAGTALPSHTLLAMNIAEKDVKSSIRVTLGRHTAEADAEKFVSVLRSAFNELNKE
ncbi:MAG: cysteine desulfurase [Clostridia bacterium]|nr:cysteine desulfurase [Clostridia bacterium]